MAEAYPSLLDGPLFTFTVGRDGDQTVEIVVHSRIISTHSKQLSTLINGPFSEAHMRHARLEDVDIATFKRFRDFVYLRTYTDPVPELVVQPSSVLPGRHENESPSSEPPLELEVEQEPKVGEDWDAFKPRKKQGRKSKTNWSLDSTDQDMYSAAPQTLSPRMERAHAKFAALTAEEDAFPASYPPLTWSPPVFDQSQDIWPVLLGHAQLCVFAEQRMTPILRSTALRRLHATLQNYTPNPKNLDAVLKLIDFAYNTDQLPDEIEGKPEPFRELVSHYVVARIDTLGSSAAFAKYLCEGGSFVSSFWVHLNKTLLVEE